MALLFLGAKDHRITARDLGDLEREFGRLNVATSEACSNSTSLAANRSGESNASREAQLAVN